MLKRLYSGIQSFVRESLSAFALMIFFISALPAFAVTNITETSADIGPAPDCNLTPNYPYWVWQFDGVRLRGASGTWSQTSPGVVSGLNPGTTYEVLWRCKIVEVLPPAYPCWWNSWGCYYTWTSTFRTLSCDPNAQEICDGIDNNCNGQIDEDVLKVNYLGGSSATIDPNAGQAVTIRGSISNDSGKPVTWNANCIAIGTEGCCVKSICNIRFTAEDMYVDPLDIHENFGWPQFDSIMNSTLENLQENITNVMGTPFAFGLSCSIADTATECN